ncbi:MAG TPA: exodeoxyribonuclease VII small subunit [Solirubrobacteraceae bacterium]|jgi:exodeoxyribonuclease VII small subunit|nr:exodeoxyribonuclease VII small subunit [Solirubrobacteraceae bacterium]
MSDAAQSQAIMFEPTDDLELRAGRGESDSQERGPAEAVQEAHSEAAGRKESDQLEPGQKGSAQTREQITFEQGYEELKGIVSRLDDPDLPVHEMFEGFRRGKGLEKALRAYLQEREGELAELEEGNNLPEFEIASPSSAPAGG